MKWNGIKDRLLGAFDGHAPVFTLPSTIVEIEPGFVAGARLEASGRRPRSLRRMGMRAVEPRALDPVPHRANFANEQEVLLAIRGVREVIGKGNGNVGLIVPDGTVRVGVLDFETLPEGKKELDALLRWKMRENLPCAPEEARLSFQIVRQEANSVELLVVAAKSSLLAEYEHALEPHGGACALVLPATLALLPLLPDASGAGQLLLHLCSGSVTSVVLENGRVILWRSRKLDHDAEEEILREATSEVSRVLASSRDRLKLDVGKVWVCARPPLTSDFDRQISSALSVEAGFLTPQAELASALPQQERTIYEQFGAAVAGLVSNIS